MEEKVYLYFRLISHFSVSFNYELTDHYTCNSTCDFAINKKGGFFNHITFVADLLKYPLILISTVILEVIRRAISS